MTTTSVTSTPDPTSSRWHRDAPAYRPGLPAIEIINELGSLCCCRLTIDRLVCRYLADLADRIALCQASSDRAGHSDVFESSERIFGYGIRATRERVRVGRALRRLPRIEQALQSGEISFARVREITRVAREDSESIWLELGKRLPIRALERRVSAASGRRAEATPKRSENPSTVVGEPGPSSVRVEVDLSMDDWVVFQQALQTVRETAPGVLTDAEAIIALAHETLRSHRPVPRSRDGALTAESQAPAVNDPAVSPSGAMVGDAPAVSRGDMGAVDERAVSLLGEVVGDDPAGSRPDVGSSNDDPSLRHAAILLRHLPLRLRWCVDELCEATGLGAAAVNGALLALQLQGTVRSEFWGYYTVRAA